MYFNNLYTKLAKPDQMPGVRVHDHIYIHFAFENTYTASYTNVCIVHKHASVSSLTLTVYSPPTTPSSGRQESFRLTTWVLLAAVLGMLEQFACFDNYTHTNIMSNYSRSSLIQTHWVQRGFV